MSDNQKPSLKQQRAQKRAAQLEEYKKKEASHKRNRLIGIVLSIMSPVVIAIVVTIIIVSAQTKPVPLGLQTWDDLEATHVEGSVNYEMTPPAGGPHNPTWLNCGIYDAPQVDENAVHSLEHGAVWITYDPAETTAAELAELRDLTPATFAILSPYSGLGPSMAISAWGAQLRFTDVYDPAVADFFQAYWRSSNAPEPGAPCTGALDGPGRVS
jgi:hypothetical protein